MLACHCFSLALLAELHDITAFKDSKIPWQPYSSTLMAIHTCQVNGRKRMQRAMIGGIRSWDTTVLPSVFPDNSYKQHIYVIDQVCGQHGLVLAELLFFWAFPWTETYCPLFFILPTAASCLITTHFKVSKYIFKTNLM